MLATHSEWYRTLDPGKKQAIRDLHRVNPYWNLVGPLFVTLWILTATAMMYLPPHWLVRIPGYLSGERHQRGPIPGVLVAVGKVGQIIQLAGIQPGKC